MADASGGFQFEWAWDEESMEALLAKVTDQRTRVGKMVAFTADPVMSFISWFGGEAAKQLNRGAPKGATGLLSRSHEFIWTRTAGGEVISRAPYALWNDRGTSAHWPPVSALRAWAEKKNLNPWAVAASIARKGTKASRYQEKAMEKVGAQLSPGLKKLEMDVVELWGAGE
jgi:hypothetical protein